jgi:hypothetical protein
MSQAQIGVAIERKIYLIRGQEVMLDSDPAELYGVPARVLVQGVKRQRRRFSPGVMFQLEDQDVVDVRSQIATSPVKHGSR